MGGKFLSHRSDNSNTSFQIHFVKGTSNKAKKNHKLTVSQLTLPQAQLHFESGDVGVHVCH
ncbi:hypothetical protein E2C01_047751 [Portunus trituberculatus]|uniref:Uncharacterized protein n=1 Tax=Portunus trituberculatus TaxID=210409 RepID=A0A5B7G8B8_PORTR|nr:hypothetical protein [Portunus trituberculatus]